MSALAFGDEPMEEMLAKIRHLGRLLDDIEKLRVANGNRVREYPALAFSQEHLVYVEHEVHLELVRTWRRHPLAPWAKSYRGVGEKSIARLIAIIGDPAERPNVAKLWAYCGHGDPARKRAKGMGQEELFRLGNPRAKKQVWLIATSLLKADNRDVYDARRTKTAEKWHDSRCVRCGPAGRPAERGSPWSAGHQHQDALRLLGKAFLRDIWIASRQKSNDAQAGRAGGES